LYAQGSSEAFGRQDKDAGRDIMGSGNSPTGAGLRFDRRRLLRSAGAIAASAVAGSTWLAATPSQWRAAAQDEAQFFRIGTGPTSGNYFAIGGIIANAISNPPGSRPCESGGSCGVPGLIAIAQTTRGSVENVDRVASKSLDSGLCQSDVAFWAYSGSGPYRGSKPLDGLRAIANLYQESLHIVVRADSPIESIRQLRNKRISLGERGAGTLATATLVLRAYGVSEKRFVGRQLPIAEATAQLAAGKIDALFLVGGAPIPALVELAQATPVRLLPVDGDAGEALRREQPFLTVDLVAADSYGTAASVVTVGIATYWLVLAELDDDLVHGITQALWHPATRKLLDRGGPLGRRIRVEDALVGLPIPLHPGAERYYATTYDLERRTE
jgi:TRAP transporter TAXI family solute receptor